jgi:hypothetical protein
MAEIGRQVIKNNISKTSTDHQTKKKPGIKGIQKVPTESKTSFLYLIPDKGIGRGKSDKVHHAVPSHGKRANTHDIRVNMGIRNHGTSKINIPATLS